MARIRAIKPSFWSNEILAELSPWHRLGFIGLWNQADREGRLEDRPRRLKAEIFPFDDVDMEAIVADLAAKGFIVRYTVNGSAYIAVTQFRKHQRPRQDEPVSTIPSPATNTSRRSDESVSVQTRERDDSLSVLADNDLPDQSLPSDGPVTAKCMEKGDLEIWRSGDLEKGEGGTGADAPSTDGPPQQRAADFAEAWNRVTSQPIPRCRDLSATRRRHIRLRLTERPLTEWEQVMARIQASAFCRGENDRGWVASFDWLIGSPDVALKVLEGKYDNRARGPTQVGSKTQGNLGNIVRAFGGKT